MNNKIERIKKVNELNKTGDINDSQALEIISNILSEKQTISKTYKPIVVGNRRNTEWTKEEEQLLKQCKDRGWRWKSIGNKLHRTPDACRVKASTLGIYKPRIYQRTPSIKETENNNNHWTEEEDNKLRKYIGNNYSLEKIAMKLGRSQHAIQCRKTI